jgi:hypothetical protein
MPEERRKNIYSQPSTRKYSDREGCAFSGETTVVFMVVSITGKKSPSPREHIKVDKDKNNSITTPWKKQKNKSSRV